MRLFQAGQRWAGDGCVSSTWPCRITSVSEARILVALLTPWEHARCRSLGHRMPSLASGILVAQCFQQLASTGTRA
jgi:hypothetical protein